MIMTMNDYDMYFDPRNPRLWNHKQRLGVWIGPRVCGIDARDVREETLADGKRLRKNPPTPGLLEESVEIHCM